MSSIFIHFYLKFFILFFQFYNFSGEIYLKKKIKQKYLFIMNKYFLICLQIFNLSK
uniref:Uncharacterized protein n=1 Tax=viral metagenome TaxID=1070528 RepID=A0A6C0AE89_9ZZZZ